MTNSTKHKLGKRKKVLRAVSTNAHSDFYKKRLEDILPHVEDLTEALWEEVPLLPREDIVGTPFWKRTLASRDDVPVIRHTYGSSGKRILITPRSSYGNCNDPYVTMNMDRVMCFFASAHNEFPREEMDIQVWFGDVGNLPMSAQIAAEAKVNSLSITPYTALIFAELLKERGAIENIRSVMIIGERCSPLQYRKICALYPNAIVYGTFASSETREVVAMPCMHDRDRGGSLVLEAIPEMYCEVVDPDTGRIITDPRVAGELVITTLEPNIPFPLIRYRTGDVAMRIERDCGCDDRQLAFEVLGRWSVLPIRLVKGELTVDALEKVLATMDEFSSDYFEIHYYEEEAEGNQALPRVHLKLLPKTEIATSKEDLAEEIATDFYVFPTYTYAKGVADGIYLPMTVDFLDKAPEGPPGKPRPPVVTRHVAEAQSEPEQRTVVQRDN